MPDNDLQNQISLAQPSSTQVSSNHASLSDRELQVIELLAEALTNEQIAEKLEISKRTVDNHISNILTKTETQNRVALVRWALLEGKVCINDLTCCPLPPYQADGSKTDN